MEKWVKLTEVLKASSEYGNILKRGIAYEPDHCTVSFKEDYVGYGEVQTFETERGISYYPVLYKDPMLLQENVYLVARDVTKKRLALYGKKGYENGIEAIMAVQRSYGNSKLGAEGRNWHQSTIGIIELLPDFWKETSKAYWMASSYIYRHHDKNIVFGLHYADPKGTTVKGQFLLYRKGGEKSYDYPSNCAIRPLIELQKDTLVCINAKSDTPLEIRI